MLSPRGGPSPRLSGDAQHSLIAASHEKQLLDSMLDREIRGQLGPPEAIPPPQGARREDGVVLADEGGTAVLEEPIE